MYPIQSVVHFDKSQTIYYNPVNNQVFIQSKKDGSGTSLEIKGTIESFLDGFLTEHAKKVRKNKLFRYIKTTRKQEIRDQVTVIKAERMAVKAQIRAAKLSIKSHKIAERKSAVLSKRMAKKGVIL